MDRESGRGLEEAQTSRLGASDNIGGGAEPIQDFERAVWGHQEPQGKRPPEIDNWIVKSSDNPTFLAIKTAGVDVTLFGSRVQPIETPRRRRTSGLEDYRRGAETAVRF